MAQAIRRPLTPSARRRALFPDVDDAAQEGARGQDHGTPAITITLGIDRTHDDAVVDDQVFDSHFDDGQVRCSRQFGLHRFAIELAVDLRPRATHGRALRAIQHLVLNATDVGHSPHQAVKRIDLTHQMALAETTDRRVA